ncbi:MAG: hypothetical protein MJA29_01150, partial [Candidatus Omnitrophica bacterium]|nr:hypothetical protein [Candidatus Omnitrophota bacterium]
APQLVPSNAEIISQVTGTDRVSESDDDSDDETPAPPKVTASSAVVAFETALAWLETQDVESIKVIQVRQLLNFAKKQSFDGKKQSVITDFFKAA